MFISAPGGLRVEALARLEDVLGRAGRVGDRGLRAALQRVQEEADVLRLGVQGVQSSRRGPARCRSGSRACPPASRSGPCPAVCRATPSTLRKPPSIAWARPPMSPAGSRPCWTSTVVDVVVVRPALVEDRLQDGAEQGDRRWQGISHARGPFSLSSSRHGRGGTSGQGEHAV